MTVSPTCSVPFCTSTVATGPRPLSSLASSTAPWPGAFGLALSSPMSATSRIISSSSSRFWRFLADTGTVTVVPPHCSGIRPRSASSFITRSGLASGLSILLIATMIGTPAARAWSIASLRLRHDAVVGRHDEDDDVGDPGAAGAHQRERLVARRVEEDHRPLVDRDLVGADVLRDAAGLALGDLRLADRVEQRRLAVVDVAHDGDDRRALRPVLGLARRRCRPRGLPPRSCASGRRRRTRGRATWPSRCRASC